MTFGQQMLATFIGSVFGFCFAIVLFYLSEHIKAKQQKIRLMKGLRKESEFNLTQIDRWLEDTDLVLRKIALSDRQLLYLYRLTDFHRNFILQCFQVGILYDVLTPKQLTNLNEVLIFFDFATTQYLNNNINLWQAAQLQPAAASQAFEFARGKLKEYREFIGEMLEDIRKVD